VDDRFSAACGTRHASHPWRENVSILKKIIKAKKAEVKLKKVKMPVDEMLKEMAKSPANRNFREIFENNPFVVIGEIKKKSPSYGTLKASVSIKEMSQLYEKAGIKAISVVTDRKYFDGRLEYIKDVKRYSSLPVLRKDFILDEYQIYESRYARADAVLLIASMLEKRVLTNFVKKVRFLNMTPVVEVHTRDEVRKAVSSGTDIIGINSRDLKTFKTNLSKIASLVKYIPADKIVICESGINTPEDVDEVTAGGRIKGILVGTLLMKARPKEVLQFVNEVMRNHTGE
jgi:indole-3-glycerol phosphate synthase